MREKEEDLGGSEAWVDPVTSQVCLASALRLGVSASTPQNHLYPITGVSTIAAHIPRHALNQIPGVS